MTTETSYNTNFVPYAQWTARQAPVPASVHNLPGAIAANGSVQSSLIATEGFSLISVGLTVTQAGTLSVQRYLDAGGTVVQGVAAQISLSANVAANLDILDGKPFASFKITITNSASSQSTISNLAVLAQVGENTTSGQTSKVIIVDPASGDGALVTAFHNADNQSFGSSVYGMMTGGVDQLVNGSGNLDRKRGVAGDGMPVTGLAAEVLMLWNGASYDRLPGSAAAGAKTYIGNTGADGSATIATGGAAQNLFGGTVPANGFFVANPDPSNDLWISFSTTALANGSGSIRVAANGGYFSTEAGLKPWQSISVIGAVTGQKFTAARW
jgi:hypothetical protein